MAPLNTEPADDRYAPLRAEMVAEIEREALDTASFTGRPRFAPAVLAALSKVPRHRFVPPGLESEAYHNGPLPIGFGQTISQPYIVALMTDLLDLGPGSTVLDLGCGSGYQAAVLAELAAQVYSVELMEELAREAGDRLRALGYRNVDVITGDGYYGCPEHAPFDGIVVAAAALSIPPALIEQLKPGGRLVIPVGPHFGTQDLRLVVKHQSGKTDQRSILPVAFVPFLHDRD